jgi:UPF0755 protein
MSSYSLLSGVRGRRRWPKIFAVFLTIILLVTVAATLVVRRTYLENLKPVSASQKIQLVTIPTGASAKEIAEQLQQAGVIRASWAFEWYVRNHDLRDKLQAGTYSLRPNQSVAEIAEVLTQGKIATDYVTILPAQRLDQIRKALINSGFAEADVDRALNPELYADHPALVDKPKGDSLEGYLYPETFQKTADTKPETIIRASLDQMQKHLTPEVRAGIVRQGLTVHEGIKLASIVEQEVSNPADKPIVAQVFLLRLRKNMALGSDVTGLYGSILAGQNPPSLTYESPYNTHTKTGLPPTPISNVSDASLKAVANPANTDFLFFVAGDDGKTYFSHTVEEHEALAREHCKKLCNL